MGSINLCLPPYGAYTACMVCMAYMEQSGANRDAPFSLLAMTCDGGQR